MSMLATTEKDIMENIPPQLPAKVSQIPRSHVLAMEKKICMVLVGLVRAVGLSAMLIVMLTVKIAHLIMERLLQKMPVKVKIRGATQQKQIVQKVLNSIAPPPSNENIKLR